MRKGYPSDIKREQFEVIRPLLESARCPATFPSGTRCTLLGEHVTAQVAKRSELNTSKVITKRWIVERSLAWLDNKNRRLWKNCERLLNTSLQFVHLAFSGLLPRRL